MTKYDCCAELGMLPLMAGDFHRVSFIAPVANIPAVLLTAVIVPFVIITVRRAKRGDFLRHKAIARWTLPMWMYVSITGVVVYLMLYHLYPST